MDEVSSLRYATIACAANKISLVQSQKNYSSFGYAKPWMQQCIRKATAADLRESGWRLFDPQSDLIESIPVDHDSTSWPDDLTSFYYWRPAKP
jgi:hypothetical protein